MSNRAGTQADFISADGLTLAQRNQAAPKGKPRTWGMLFTVTNDPNPANNTTWYLKYNQASTNIYDNDNWITLADAVGGGGGGALPGTLVNCGDWDASGGLFPDLVDARGTGVDGAIDNGNKFTISVAGEIAGVDLPEGAIIIAKTNNPGQVLANWDTIQ